MRNPIVLLCATTALVGSMAVTRDAHAGDPIYLSTDPQGGLQVGQPLNQAHGAACRYPIAPDTFQCSSKTDVVTYQEWGSWYPTLYSQAAVALYIVNDAYLPTYISSGDAAWCHIALQCSDGEWADSGVQVSWNGQSTTMCYAHCSSFNTSITQLYMDMGIALSGEMP